MTMRSLFRSVESKQWKNNIREDIEVEYIDRNLIVFLSGTLDPLCPLRLLRGQGVILRIIWTWVCEEWWQTNIQPCGGHASGTAFYSLSNYVSFPPVGFMPENNTETNIDSVLVGSAIQAPVKSNNNLKVTMMPFYLDSRDSLPHYCQQYWPLIQKCAENMEDVKNKIAYLSIDEVDSENLLRYSSGIRVAAHGKLPKNLQLSDYSEMREENTGGFYHPYRDPSHRFSISAMSPLRKIIGGMFMASTLPHAASLWNCRVVDQSETVIGPYGNINRMRDVLGAPSKKLEANELVWLTDKTPFESLSHLRHNSNISHQNFQLVVGEVKVWFADQYTSNPLGVLPPPEVSIVFGQKSEVYHGVPISWHEGSPSEIYELQEHLQFRSLLCQRRLGHVGDRLERLGVSNIPTLVEVGSNPLFILPRTPKKVSRRFTGKKYAILNRLFGKMSSSNPEHSLQETIQRSSMSFLRRKPRQQLDIRAADLFDWGDGQYGYSDLVAFDFMIRSLRSGYLSSSNTGVRRSTP